MGELQIRVMLLQFQRREFTPINLEPVDYEKETSRVARCNSSFSTNQPSSST